MRAFLVTHTHWDREWYRPFQAFRARLVDAVDRVLELCAADPGYRFLLDGQSIASARSGDPASKTSISPSRAGPCRHSSANSRLPSSPSRH